ncbi:MAG TPA: SDR family oxidoreductase [Actinomycetota bacterium]|nr:SDR family oxidoreductase [Actinomycetota bacterium]
MTDLFSLAGKTALVTGGSRGIGFMIAQGFIEAGARVYVSSRKKEACDEAASQLGPNAVSMPADISTEQGCIELARSVAEREDALHVLVNNAGTAWGAPLEEFPDHAFDKIWATNVKAIFHLTVKCLPLLRKAASQDDPARVINIGSIDGLRVPIFQNYAYSASKSAVHMLTRHVAHEIVGEHITVNAIAPGLFESKMTKAAFEFMGDQIAEHIPMKRSGRPDDIAGTAIFLASRAGAYLTGAVIPVDGGVSTR